jgi:hypothetical protein
LDSQRPVPLTVGSESATAAAGRIDALVSNAGETLRAPLEEVERLFRLNTVGALRSPTPSNSTRCRCELGSSALQFIR